MRTFRQSLPALALALSACARPGIAPAPVPASERAALTAFVDSLAGDARFRNAHWGILVVDPARGDTLYSRNAGKLFMPASNQKLLTGSTALAQLGPDYRWRTIFRARGRGVADGALLGDLLVEGRGDPSISDHMVKDAMIPLRAIADSLAARGIRRITGRIIPWGDAFPDSSLGGGGAWDDLNEPYSAGIEELYFNEGFTRVTVRAVAGGEAPTAVTAPVAGMPGAIVIRGTILQGDSSEIEITWPDQHDAYVAALTAALAERGIAVEMGPTDRSMRVDSLFTTSSPTLREVMPILQKPSQNQVAEIFLKTLGLEKTGVGSADSGRRVVERQLVAWGADTAGFAVRDGSGLSRHDYVTPETIIHVLDAMRKSPDFRVFYDALPIAGVDGTIRSRMRNTAAQGNVHAKTGFVDKARSLSGYVTTADGRLLLFSMLANNWTVPVRDVERVQDAVAVRLATLGAK
jgi:D-alanyl-D-alanine carboxypeptidase/D-alanyl-D-alanine-endopeptidase (penicillin-binding protein 4)